MNYFNPATCAFVLAMSLAGASPALGAVHPVEEIEKAHPGVLKAELAGVHPRVFFTDAELAVLRSRAQTTHRELWARALGNMTCLTAEPAPAPAQARRAQNETAYGIAEAAFAYRMTGDAKYLAAARKYMEAAVSYDVWGYTYNKPNVDLAAGHLLYGLSMGYDLLYNDLTPEERARYREKLAKQAHLLFESYKLSADTKFAYSQNHLFIPAAGLGIAAYALYGEVPEARQWAARARAIYDRVLATYSKDGYYYEGFEYWVFSTPWIVHYLDALGHSTGEDLYDQPGLRHAHEYLAHAVLPNGTDPVDFGDVFEGPVTRAGQGEEYPRTHPGGRLHSNYALLYRLAQRFQSPEAQGVAQHLAALGQTNFEDWWSLAWYDDKLAALPIERQPRFHHFEDAGVAYWRSGWGKDATEVVFKAGPPEGHATAELLKRFPDWRTDQGHAHPDAGSFVLFANGKYVSGVSGYAGVPMTDQANAMLVNGKGQANEGNGHDAFRGFPYGRLNQIRIERFAPTATGFTAIASLAGAYDEKLGVEGWTRTLSLEGRTLRIADAVSFRTASTPTFFVHFDGAEVPAGVTLESALARASEPNVLTAPGKPGSVADGPRETRGSRVRLSPTGPTERGEYETVLKW